MVLVVVPMLVIPAQDENQWSFSNNYVRVNCFAEHFKLEVKPRLDKPKDRLMLMLLMVIVVVGKVGVYQEPLESLVTEVC